MKWGLATLALVAALSWAASAAAAALPPGWRLEGSELVWTSDLPLRMGGARYEFRASERLLGYPAQRGNTLRLRLPPGTSLDDLSVRAAGRRLDGDALRARMRTTHVTPRAEPAISQAAFDPAARGPYETRRLKYELPGLSFPDYPAPIEVLAEVTAPVGHTSGPMPLVLFLHGRHSTCYLGGPGGEVSGDWPCFPGWRPVPSHTGYRYITEVLASRGYLTVSIAANGINGQDGMFADGGSSARSELVRHHLAQWAEWSAHGGDPWGDRFKGRVNLDEVVLVGHSRGGEGVVRATIDSYTDDPWQVRGLVLIGPTAFGRQVAPGVHTTVILPFCDGDVSDLQGQRYVDVGRDLTRDRALRTSIVAMGTNHNYYNTEWTPGLSKSPAWDDWLDAGDPQCGENRRRLAPAEQQSVGLAYTAALVNLAIDGDTRSLPLLDGTRVKPRSIGRASAFVHSIGGNKRVLFAAGQGGPVRTTALTARECRGYYTAGPFDVRTGCTPRLFFELIPHWSPMASMETAPAPRALRVDWSKAGGSLRIPVTPNSDHGDSLDFRIAGEPGAAPVEFDVRVRDAAGRWTALGRGPLTLRSYHGPAPLGKVLARQLRAPIGGIDAGRIAEIELIPRTPRGRFWLLDVSTRDHNTLAPLGPIQLPKVSVGGLVVPEGSGGETTIELPVTIEGEVARRARLWVQLTNSADFDDPTSGIPLVLEPGATSATIPFTYRADLAYDPFEQVTQVTLLARKNAVTGDFAGTVRIVEDDPAPKLGVDAAHVTAAEGAALEWTFRLSEPMANRAFWSVQIVPANGRFHELDTDDVDPAFLEQFGITPPDPAVPLSELGLSLGIEFEAGATVKTVTIPTRTDGVAEPAEGVALLLDGFEDPVVPQPIEMTGLVTVSP